MSKDSDMHLEYLHDHRWGLMIDGGLYKEYETFDEAADDYEAHGGMYPDV